MWVVDNLGLLSSGGGGGGGIILKIGECYTARNWILYNPAPKFTSNYSYGSWNLFHSDDNRSELCAILDDLPI